MHILLHRFFIEKATMQLYLLRHAQSESNARWDKNPGESFHYPDPGLTPTGQKQAEAVAAALARRSRVKKGNPHDPWNYTGFGITHIYASLMVRAVETADRVASQLDLPILGQTDLHEWGGVYEMDLETREKTGIAGSDRAFFEQHYPRVCLPEDFNDAGWWSRPYEMPDEVTPRAQRVLENLIAKHRDTHDRVLVVSHGGFLNHLISTVVNLEPQQTQRNLDGNLWWVLNNTAITRMEISNDFTGIVYHNRIDHLSPDLIT